MIETNEASLKLRFGTANVTGTADKLTVYHAIPSGESLVLVFEIAMTGNRVKRIVVADGTITEFDDTTYSAGDAIGYGVTMSANPSDLINGATSVEYIANVTTASLSKSFHHPRPPSGGRTLHPERTRIWQPSSRRATRPRKTSPGPSRPWASPSPSAPRSSTTSTWSNTSTTSRTRRKATAAARSPSSPSSRSCAATSTRR